MQTTLSFGQKPAVAPSQAAKKRPLVDHPQRQQESKSARSSSDPTTGIEAAPTAAAVWAAIRQQRVLGLGSSNIGHTLADRQREEAVLLPLRAQAPPSDASRGSNGAGSGGAGGAKSGKGEAGWRRVAGGQSAYVTATGKRLSGKAAFAAAARDKGGK